MQRVSTVSHYTCKYTRQIFQLFGRPCAELKLFANLQASQIFVEMHPQSFCLQYAQIFARYFKTMYL